MKVILQKDLKNLGQTGDVVSVKKGYARHWLFPKKWAIPFTQGSAAQNRHRQLWIESKKKKALALRQDLIEKIKGISLSFMKEADSSGRLFGSLTVFEISKQLQLQGYEVDKRVIKLDRPLKETGEYTLLLDFGSDMKTEIKVCISPVVSENKETKSLKG